MKYFKILAILVFSSVISFYGCKDNTTSTPKQEKPQPLDFSNTPNSPNAATSNQATTESAQNVAGVWHYTCGKGCAGGSASAGNCATCGDPLAHNQAYHANTNNTSTANPLATPISTTPAETGKNAAGVWHYTCGNGCAGGSGTAGNCGTCGDALAHNTAYHQ